MNQNNPSELIQAAFEQARIAGKKDWQHMTVAVLKNRLLSLTGGTFKEEQFGARTVADFVRKAGAIVELDDTRFPPVVSLAATNIPNEQGLDERRWSPPKRRRWERMEDLPARLSWTTVCSDCWLSLEKGLSLGRGAGRM
jgi:hypothetical protein